jgi:dUTP pyrophosphatase
MQIQSLHPAFIMPIKASEKAGAYDIYMPEAGTADGTSRMFGLGFATAIPDGYVALLLPRSSSGAKHGLELNNTCGVIDSDYRGEWKAALKTKSGLPFQWNMGDRILQFMILPVATVQLNLIETLSETNRGVLGFGSTGK